MDDELSKTIVSRMYEVFARYENAGEDFCGFCYSQREIKRITRAPVAALDAELGRKLLWEAADHWESANVYRHYLPRLLELLGPPRNVEDCYTLHLSETLIAMGFRGWPSEEQTAVLNYLEYIASALEGRFDHEDRDEWAAGIASLRASGD